MIIIDTIDITYNVVFMHNNNVCVFYLFQKYIGVPTAFNYLHVLFPFSGAGAHCLNVNYKFSVAHSFLYIINENSIDFQG